MLELKATPRNFTCIVKTIMDKLDPEDKTILTQALNDNDSFPADQLAMQLRNNGFPISGSPIRRHRRGSCSC